MAGNDAAHRLDCTTVSLHLLSLRRRVPFNQLGSSVRHQQAMMEKGSHNHNNALLCVPWSGQPSFVLRFVGRKPSRGMRSSNLQK